MKISDKTYDTLKIIGLIAVPILTFLAALVSIWNVPYAEQITLTLSAIDTLVGSLVVILNTIYKNRNKELE